MIEENILIFECPECGIKVEVKGCRTCEYIEDNLSDYQHSQPCLDCDMFHKNYKRKKE